VAEVAAWRKTLRLREQAPKLLEEFVQEGTTRTRERRRGHPRSRVDPVPKDAAAVT
jgi:hypothetical protein